MTTPAPTGSGRCLRHALLSAALAGALGCASLTAPPASPVPALDPAASAARLAEFRLSDPDLAEVLRASGLSRTSRSDATWNLDALTVAAWHFRGEVAAARAALAAARAGERVAAARPALALTFTPELVTTALTGLNPWTLALALSSTFESHGKRELRRQRARAESAVQAADLAEVLWAVRGEVRQALLDLELARRESALADREVALRTEFVRWLSGQLAAGTASRPDLAAAEADLARAGGQAELARIEVPAADSRLAMALGLSPAALAAVACAPPDLDALPAPLDTAGASALRQQAVHDRLDLNRALASYAVTLAELRSEVAKQFPDWTLGPGVTYDRGDRKLVLGVGLVLPPAAGQRAATARAAALVAQAGAVVESIQAQALAETAGAIDRYGAARAALDRAEAAHAERAATVGNAERRRDLGAADRGDVLTAALIELESRRGALAIRRAAVSTLTDLERGVQRPVWPPSALRADTDAAPAPSLPSSPRSSPP